MPDGRSTDCAFPLYECGQTCEFPGLQHCPRLPINKSLGIGRLSASAALLPDGYKGTPAVPIVARESADMSRIPGLSRDMESMRTTTSAMQSTAAHHRHVVEETRSTIAATRASILCVDTLLLAPMFQLRLISINQASLSPMILTRPI